MYVGQPLGEDCKILLQFQPLSFLFLDLLGHIQSFLLQLLNAYACK